MNGLIAALLSAGILGAAFLPWFEVPMVFELSLWDVIRDNTDAIREVMSEVDTPWGIWCFIASFPVALLSLIANIGGFRRVLSLVTGVLPLAAFGWVVFSARDRTSAVMSDLPVDRSDLFDLVGAGVWLYAGAAAALVLMSIVGGGRRRG
ncbi:hypothetical protein [Roseisalinus antarcticus]|uniref:Uncharacterized protein n=1 Tax=Roseisalinus antarcticus TaxID=254357 RepID=A0A1Y5U154_9RHOB|nr:hypothetical protein [Roseisalinus antarcticus]SLN75999.1 hypothetical protein ROA7023_04076 [Roseisalinus antarcticus]